MEIEIKRMVQKEVEETVKFELEKYYVVRIIQDKGYKSCIAEYDYAEKPTEEQIAVCLIKHHKVGNVFATVEENYRLVDEEEKAWN